ncbi:hypothetical protein [Streptomyces sp. NPDC057413]|uniref:hypothetical protein n=1 Tax=Streptomyces sp. NPDC057413 TaxID=3346124 RepID=UPI0036B859E9
MPLRADHLPMTPKALWEAVVRLRRDVNELRASRRLESAVIDTGGITAVGADGTRASLGAGASAALLASTGQPTETAPGSVGAAWNGAAASLRLTSPDVGSGSIVIVLDTTGLWQLGELWTALTMTSGWTAAGGAWQSPRLVRQVDGTVQLDGSAIPGTTTAGTQIATLPAGYRPAADHEYRVSGGSATSACDLFVKSTGAITINNISGTLTRISFSTIRFPLT